MEYINSNYINKPISFKINNCDLEIVKIDGTIYRGDVHSNQMLRKFPTYF